MVFQKLRASDKNFPMGSQEVGEEKSAWHRWENIINDSHQPNIKMNRKFVLLKTTRKALLDISRYKFRICLFSKAEIIIFMSRHAGQKVSECCNFFQQLSQKISTMLRIITTLLQQLPQRFQQCNVVNNYNAAVTIIVTIQKWHCFFTSKAEIIFQYCFKNLDIGWEGVKYFKHSCGHSLLYGE